MGTVTMLSIALIFASTVHGYGSGSIAHISVDWSDHGVVSTSSAAVSVLVAADPEWLPGAKMHDAAIAGIKSLATAGASNIRLLNFNIFPAISCASLTPGSWNTSLMDTVMSEFMDACGNASVIIDVETSPTWMWADANETDTHTCAMADSITLPVGPRTRCPNYGNPHTPKDPSWGQIAKYFKRVADWYTKGGFTDELGNWHSGGFHYKFDYWEILNEPQLTREHALSTQQVNDYYDAMVLEFGDERPSTKFLGPSFCCMGNTNKTRGLIGSFLNATKHKPNVPVDGVSFHIYGACKDNTPAGMENIFTTTDWKKDIVVEADKIRNEVRPEAELHLTESGLFCNELPGKCNGGNDYPCWYRSFDNLFWVASAGQWLYQYLTYAAAANMTTIAQSQILGYPYQYNGLSGEWASGSMVDWTDTPGLNAKYYVSLLLLEQVARPFQYLATSNDSPNVYATGLSSSKGRVVVFINKRSTNQSVSATDIKGKVSHWIEAINWKAPPSKRMLTSDSIVLSPFAVVFVEMD